MGPTLTKQYIKNWCILQLLKCLETNKNTDWCADHVLSEEITRNSGLIVIKDFLICHHDPCARMRFTLTHYWYELLKKESGHAVLHSLYCSVISIDHWSDSGVKHQSDKTESFHQLNSLTRKGGLMVGCLDDIHELYSL